jgi:hypothetical protein
MSDESATLFVDSDDEALEKDARAETFNERVQYDKARQARTKARMGGPRPYCCGAGAPSWRGAEVVRAFVRKAALNIRNRRANQHAAGS